MLGRTAIPASKGVWCERVLLGGVSGPKVRTQVATWHPRRPPSRVFDLLCDGLGLPGSCCSAVLLQVWRRCGLLAGFGSFWGDSHLPPVSIAVKTELIFPEVGFPLHIR